MLVYGATHDVRQKLADDFEAKKIRKEYQLIVSGIPSENSWTVDGPIGDLTQSKIRIRKWVIEGGLSAETHFVVEDVSHEKSDARALLRVFPKTGRTIKFASMRHTPGTGFWGINFIIPMKKYS
jgi:23S rRNA-/tRNA-specific pseudouridylate synthase